MKRTVNTAIILAGGSSKRMGRDKTHLNLKGKSLIEIVVDKLVSIFTEVIIAGNTGEDLSHLPVVFTRDIIVKPFKNSLTGVHAGLSRSSSEYSFVVACDMPFLNLELVDFMSSFPVKGYDALVPKVKEGHQALHSVYSKSCIPHLKEHLEKDSFRIGYFITRIKTKYIPQEDIEKYDPKLLSFFNINTKEDYQKALMLVEENPDLISLK